MDNLYTVNEVANMLKVTPTTIRNWINAGNLKTVRIGKNVRITEKELKRIMRER